MSLGEREAGARWFPPFMLQGISRSHLAPVLRSKANQFKSISPKFVPAPIVLIPMIRIKDSRNTISPFDLLQTYKKLKFSSREMIPLSFKNILILLLISLDIHD